MSSRKNRALVAAMALVLAMGTMPSAAASPSGQLCSEPATSPVLQDSGWHLINASANYYDFTTAYLEPSVIKVGGTYVMYVREDINGTGPFGIYRGTSTDGMNWNMSSSPVLSPGPSGSWDGGLVFSPDVVWNGTGYLMYYVGDATSPTRNIGVAFSSDGMTWTKSADNPIITHGPGEYDSMFVRGPNVIYEGGAYKMWYTGTYGINSSKPLTTAIDYATSPDGVHWAKYAGNPVFTGYYYSAVGQSSAFWPSVFRYGGTYFMAFGSGTSYIGYATSADGISWAFNNSSQPLVSLQSWHNNSVGNPAVLFDGTTLRLWFLGTSTGTPYVGGVAYATCGTLIVAPPVTTTETTVTTQTYTQTSTETATTTVTSTSASTQTSTQVVTTVSNPNLSSVQALEAFFLGLVAALAVAVVIVFRKVRAKQQP
jgi:predicted GH43/DUF377 family glycosyl hydrolase